MPQCRTSGSKQPASCTFVLQGKAYVVLCSGVIAEADGRTAASGGWRATMAMALEADALFDARQQALASELAILDSQALQREQELAELQRTDIVKWAKVVKEAGIKPE